MKPQFLLLLIALFPLSCFAQQTAITQTGEEVILYADGTWKYKLTEDAEKYEIPTSKKRFKNDKNSTFLLKSKILNVGFWLNPKLWSFEKAVDNEEAEYDLTMRNEDLYAMIITEKTQIPLETLREIAFENGLEVAPDLQIIDQEYRMVNGEKVLFMKMYGTISGIKFAYFGYYFSNENGTLQYICYTSQNLIEEYEDECEKLLNGLVTLTGNE
jgi:hypothetical protein